MRCNCKRAWKRKRFTSVYRKPSVEVIYDRQNQDTPLDAFKILIQIHEFKGYSTVICYAMEIKRLSYGYAGHLSFIFISNHIKKIATTVH